MTSIFTFDEPLSLGQKVRMLRAAYGWRQSDLAFHAAVTPGAVSAVERGRPFHPDVLARIGETFGVELSDDQQIE